MVTQRYFGTGQTFFNILFLWLVWIQPSFELDSLPVALYLDSSCSYSSPVNPNVNIPLNTCVVTPGAYGFKPTQYACADGSAVQILKYQRACGGSGWTVYEGSCNSFYGDPVAGLVAFCGAQEQLQLTSTTTIAVATNILTATRAATASITTSITSSLPTTSAIQVSGTTGSPSSSGPSSHGWSALSNGEKVGAVIALAVGIPSVFFAAVGVWIMCVRGRG